MSMILLQGLGQKLSLGKDTNQVSVGRIKGRPFAVDTLTEAQLNHHVHVVGASGFGKTVFLSQIIKQQIEQGKGLFFIDLKSDIETMTKFLSFVTACGREKDFQNFSITEPSLSMSYNILGGGSATQIRDRIMTSLEWSEEFYKNVSGSFLLKVLSGLVYLTETQGFAVNLSTVLKAVESQDFLNWVHENIPAEEKKVKASVLSAYNFLGVAEN
ncbi:MAG: DUF853 family protein, partial [Proteobacteria bacterium]